MSGKIIKLIQQLQQSKQENVEYEPIEVVAEYAKLMEDFVSIELDQRKHGLNNIADRV